MSDWEEIRRLAADFQKAQSAGSAQKLSERNCIEIVTKLIELKLIDVIFTNDGKEYLTHQQMVKEINDEMYVSGGRISLGDLAKLINVDYGHIVHYAEQISRDDDIHLVLGQLLSAQYMDNMATAVNEKLQQNGMINISSLIKEYDLPMDFIEKQIHARVGSIIEGFRDEDDKNIILTPSYIARNRAKLRGVLSAVTVPTSCSTLSTRFGFPDKLFMLLAEELIRTKRIPGILSGGKTLMKATFIPNSYAKSQNSWVENFYASNGYLEYKALARVGISDAKGFIKRKYKDEDLLFLDSCCLGPAAVDQVKSSLDNAMCTGSWIDLVPVLPSVLSQQDEDQLIEMLMQERPNSLILGSTTVLSMPLVEKVRSDVESSMDTKATEDIAGGVIARLIVDSRGANNKDDDEKVDKKDERRKKAAGGKAGGGAQGRETKTKSTKKKGGKKNKDEDWGDSDDDIKTSKGKTNEKTDLEFKSLDELRLILQNMSILKDMPEQVYGELAQYLHRGLNVKYKELAMSMYQATLTKSMHNKRKTHSELQDAVNSQYTSFRLHVKGLHEIKNETNKENLAKHLLKTSAVPLLNEILLYVAEENMIKVSEAKELSANDRQNIIKELPSGIADPAMKLNKAATGASADDFLKILEEESLSICDVMLKKQDKKKDKQILFNHRHEMQDKLGSCDDPALGLHLAALIIFQHFTGQILQASGKFVPSIVSHLQQYLSEEQNQLLSNHQQLVVKQLKEKDCDLSSELEDCLSKLKEMITNMKKQNKEEE